MNMNHQTQLFIYYFIFMRMEIICETSTFEEELLKLTYEIVKKYFKHYRCITYITANLEPPLLKINQPVININLTDDFSQDKILIESFEQGCGGYVIRTANITKEEVIRRLIRAYGNSTNFRYNHQRYLYLPYDEKDNSVTILEMREMFYMPNFLKIIVTHENFFNFSILTHNYFHGYKYDILGIKYESIESWTSTHGFHHGFELYWDKIENLNHKKITLAMNHFPLYAIVINETDDVIFDGLETRIAAVFVEKNNGTWGGLDHNQEWGEISEDGTADGGIFKSVQTHKADLGYSAIYQWFCDVLDCSYPYVYAGVTCLVPRPQLLPGWETVILPFTPITWISLITAYFVSSMMVLLISALLEHMEGGQGKPPYGHLIFESFFKTFRLQLGQIPKEVKGKSSLAVYLRWLALYYFVAASCWSGGIASLLTVPRYEPPINTVADLTSRYPQMEWGANSIDWTISIKQTSEPLLRKIVEKFVVMDEDALEKRIKTRDFAFFIERLPNGHYGMNEFLDEESLEYLKIMEENIYTANAVTVLPKGSPYRERLDKVSLERINNRLQDLITSSTEKPVNEATNLHIKHLEGAIYIYIGGILLSTTVFFIELFFNKIHQRKKFWNGNNIRTDNKVPRIWKQVKPGEDQTAVLSLSGRMLYHLNNRPDLTYIFSQRFKRCNP